jgi:ABC-type glutathione transport system ATPase component
VLRLRSLTQCPCVTLRDFTTCYCDEGACSQRLKLKWDELLANVAFTFTLRRYDMVLVGSHGCGKSMLAPLVARANTRPLFGSTQALSVG